jgi:hypothetical protein
MTVRAAGNTEYQPKLDAQQGTPREDKTQREQAAPKQKTAQLFKRDEYVGSAEESAMRPPYSAGLNANLKTVFSKSATDTVNNHNQALDAYGVAAQQKLIDPSKPMTMIHADTHSDIHGQKATEESIANYINKAMKDGSVDRVIWAMPDEAFKPENKEHFLSSDPASRHYMANDRTSDTIYVNKDTGEMKFASDNPKPEDVKDWRKVEFQKMKMSDLPDMKGKNVWLDIDADYFANSGHDTNGGVKIPFKGEKGFEDFTAALKDKNVQPNLTTCARSPEYTTGENKMEVERFFGQIAKNSKVYDLAKDYKHTDPYPQTVDENRGVTLPRGSTAAECAVPRLQEEVAAGAATSDPKKANIIPLDERTEKGRAALEVAKQCVPAKDPNLAKKLLESLQTQPGVIDLNTAGERDWIDSH